MSDTEECLINVAASLHQLDDAERPQLQHPTAETTTTNTTTTTTTTTTTATTSDDDEADAAPPAANIPHLMPGISGAPAPSSAGQQAAVPPPTTSSVVASHYNTLEEKGLAERSQSRIFHMRNFNNWIKSMLINEYITRIRDGSKLGAPLRVLDMCCGKGGDLYKWEKAHITHLICTDIAAVSVEQCEARYNALTARPAAGGGKHFSAEFFACDSTRTRLRNQYKDPSVELNLVSCQFAFHYCFESLQQAECMVKNAAECLRTGGYFIGTIPDSYELVRRQRMAGNGERFGNAVYEVGFLCDAEEPPLFGGKYNFKLQGVVDCPEFLVHFPLLVKLARKFGLQLVMRESFGTYFGRMVETSKGLIEKMQGLQTYPSHEHQPQHMTPEMREQFAHAATFLAGKEGGDRHRKCGTLSLAEWEATSIYIVFAFQKMEKKFDSKGHLYFD